jgi:hypothetical protein
MYIGLWSRLEGFDRDALTRALERRRVVQGTLMRSTIHLVSASDYWPFAVAIRRARRDAWLKTRRGHASAREMAAAARVLRRRLGDDALSRVEIKGLLRNDSVLTNGVGLWLDLVRVPPSGTWERRRADLYAAAEDWLGRPTDLAPKEGLAQIVTRYLGGFGPASTDDIASWSGIPRADVAAACRSLKLRRFYGERGGELVDLPRAPLPEPETPAPARFLPVWDAILLAHARRTGVLRDEHRPAVFNARTPHSVNTFLVDGVVAGTWSHDRGRIRMKPFRRLDAAVRRELNEEAERLAELHR